MKELPRQPAAAPESEMSEEVAAPHLADPAAADAASVGDEEVWVTAPFGPPSQEQQRLLTAEEKWPSEWHAMAWMAAHGASQLRIAEELSYHPNRVSAIMNKPAVQEKIEQIRKDFLGTESLTKKFAAVAPKAAEFMSAVITGKEAAKTETRMQASQWMLEKVTGKPKQEGATDGGTTILQLLQALDSVKEMRVAAAEGVRPVTEHNDIELEKKPKDSLAEWVTANVPGEK